MAGKIPVIFKYERGSRDVVAFFPTLAGTCDPATLQCYAHKGQHASAALEYVRECRPASVADYTPLLNELYSVGYKREELQIVKRMTDAHHAARRLSLRHTRGG